MGRPNTSVKQRCLNYIAHSFKKIKSSHSRSLNLGLKFSPVSVTYPNMFHLVPVRCPYERPLSQKMTFGICFCHPMRNFVFMPITAVFQEKFHAWYQTKGNDMVHHLRRAKVWETTRSHKKAPKCAPACFWRSQRKW